jgi:hypothetical protein
MPINPLTQQLQTLWGTVRGMGADLSGPSIADSDLLMHKIVTASQNLECERICTVIRGLLANPRVAALDATAVLSALAEMLEQHAHRPTPG